LSDEGFGLAPPAFKPEEALLQLKRQLRDLKLAERGIGFELRGKRVAELQVEGASLAARTARKLALTPEWDRQTIASAGDQRKWMDELKKRLARWDREE
jgi:hypothetical protein